MSDQPPLAPDLAAFRDSYVALFGALPPLPAGKFAFVPEFDAEGLRIAERYRAHAFETPVFDEKTTQLLIFAMLLARGEPPAKWHAIAARRLGATWEQLTAIAVLASATAALGPLNVGGSMLAELRAEEARRGSTGP